MATQIVEMDNPLGQDLLLHRLHGEESLSFLFEYRLDLLSARSDIDADDLLGKNFSIKLGLADGEVRYFTGYVTEFSTGDVVSGLFSYHAVLRPWTWFMTRTSDCRIFQGEKIPDIIQKMFDKYSLNKPDSTGLSGDYEPWEYCVQYRESDFNFISRLMEHEGIYYYFRHDDQGHTLMMVDHPGAHAPAPGFETFPFYGESSAVRTGIDRIREWRASREIRSGNYETTDYDFKNTTAALKQHKDLSKEPALIPQGEVFDYPGGYVKTAQGETYATVRLEEIQSAYQRVNGSGNTRAMQVGNLFTLERHPVDVQNGKYLVTRLTSQISISGYEAGEESGVKYSCQFSAIPSEQQFRPRRVTPKPVVQGPQTAVVVGPADKEIYCDEFGRVKVQFFWDRHGDHDENSSCWIRVSQPWAGKGFGMLANPRIHHEVIVDFLEGDPDQPIITGRVYNGDQKVPYDPKGHGTQTGIKSRSSPGGSHANFNEILFDDKKGSELFSMSAEKDMVTSVKNNATRTVNVNDATTIHGDQNLSIVGNQTITITGTVGETVTGKVTNTYNNGKFETVNNGITEFSTSFKNVYVNGWRHEEINGDATTNATGFTNHSSSGAMNFVSSAALGTTSSADTKIVAGGKCVISAGGDFKAVAPNFKFATGGDMVFTATNFNRTIMQGNDTILGPNSNSYMGNASDTKIGMARSTFIGLKQDTSVAAGIYIDVALKMGTAVGVELKLNAAACIETKVAGIGQASMDLELKGLKVISGGGGGGGGGGGAGAAAGAAAEGAVSGGSLMAGAAAASGLTAAILGIVDVKGAVDSYSAADKAMGLDRQSFSGWGALAGGLVLGGPAGVVVGGLVAGQMAASAHNEDQHMPIPSDPDVPAPPTPPEK